MSTPTTPTTGRGHHDGGDDDTGTGPTAHDDRRTPNHSAVEPTGVGPTPNKAGKASFFASPAGRHAGLIAALIALCIFGFISAGDRFATGSNLENLLVQGSVIGVLSVGMTFVIISGGIDLSIGSLTALSAVWCTTIATQDMAEKYSFWVIVATAVIVGSLAGLLNGVLVAYGPIVPFIMTLATMAAAKGLAERISDKRTQVIADPAFKDFFTAPLFGVRAQFVAFALVALVGWIVLNRTTFGRRTYAVGGNPEAARLAGINVRRHTALVYVLMGACCGIAAVLLVARVNSGSSNLGLGYELDAIAAVVIGGTLLTGGRGTIVGTVIGVVIFSVLNNVFTLNNLEQSDQSIAKGAIIVIAVLLQQRFSRNSRRT